MSRRFTNSLIVALILSPSAAFGDLMRMPDARESLAAIPGPADVGGPRTFLGTGFEPTEGYLLGMPTANGWRCPGGSPPAGSRCPGTPDPGGIHRNPDSTLSGVVAKGNGSSQSLFLNQNFNHPIGVNVGIFSPKFKDFSLPTLNFDIRIDDAGGANYQLVAQTPLQTFTTARVLFYYLGGIYVLDDPGGTLQYVQIGTYNTTPPSTWYTFQLEFDYANDHIRYFRGPDKDHLQLLYTGGVFGGTQVEELVLFSDNYQNQGSGSMDGAPRGPGAYIDNIVFKPEPTTFAMLISAGLLALRRRSMPAK